MSALGQDQRVVCTTDWLFPDLAVIPYESVKRASKESGKRSCPVFSQIPAKEIFPSREKSVAWSSDLQLLLLMQEHQCRKVENQAPAPCENTRSGLRTMCQFTCVKRL